MAERLVDVLNSSKAAVIHTFPITIGGLDIASKEAEYEEKALKAAAHAQLVPDADLKGLTTRMHVSRGGALEPYGDDRGSALRLLLPAFTASVSPIGGLTSGRTSKPTLSRRQFRRALAKARDDSS